MAARKRKKRMRRPSLRRHDQISSPRVEGHRSMDRVLGHHLMLLAAATALGAMSHLAGWPPNSEPGAPETAAVITVPRPTREPPTAPAPAAPAPRDMASLT